MPDLAITIGIVFVMTAIFAGSLAALVLNRPTEARRRLDRIMSPVRERVSAAPATQSLTLTDRPGPTLEKVSKVLPTSTKETSRIRRRQGSASDRWTSGRFRSTACSSRPSS